jgi:hypothetical protein
MESAAQDRRRALALGALSTLLYLATAPDVVNLDGLGYLKLLPHNFAAGHLLFMPALRLATRLCGGDGLRAGRLLDALLGGSGVVLTYGIARRLVGHAGQLAADARFAATVAAAGVAVSYGYWVQGSDVEAYAAAEVALLCTVRLLIAYRGHPTAARALAVGAMLGVAVLCHLTHALASLLVAASLISFAPTARTGRWHALLALTVGGALSIGAYAYAALVVRGHDLDGALRWIGTAAHGFHYGGGPYKLADALYGLAKCLVWSPYLYEADAQKLLGQFLLGLFPLVALGALALARRPSLARPSPSPSLDGRLGAAWVLPYALVGVLFFGSDSERWLFVLVPLWLVAGALLSTLPRRRAVAIAVVAYFGVVNLYTAILPAHRETWTRHRATATAERLGAGDLLIFPGHSWDEYVSFFARGEIEPFPVAYYAARDGVAACLARLERAVAAARAHGGQVYAVRLFDGHDDDPRGVVELDALGFPRSALEALLQKGFTLVPQPIEGEGVTLVRLDPP